MKQCSECLREMEAEKITLHGTCWKCHLASVNLSTHLVNRVPSGDRFKDYLPEGEYKNKYPPKGLTEPQQMKWLSSQTVAGGIPTNSTISVEE